MLVLARSKLFFTVFVALLCSQCYHDDSSSSSNGSDCSTISGCNPGRLKQVQLFAYESETATVPEPVNFRDKAKFLYSDEGRWIGGERESSKLSNLSYDLAYNGTEVTSYLKTETGEFSFQIDTDYFYKNELLDYSETITTREGVTVLGAITYPLVDRRTYIYNADDQIEEIRYDVDLLLDTDGTLSYLYQNDGTVDYSLLFGYENSQMVSISCKELNGDKLPFKIFTYNANEQLASSRTFEPCTTTLVENISYTYYNDGALRSKTILFDGIKEEIIYFWEAGTCEKVEIFGDRGYPTPEHPNFPCF